MSKKTFKTFIAFSLVAVLGFVFMNVVGTPSSIAGSSKVTICHKVGGAEVTLNVADDGAAGGHIPNHTGDSFGPCATDSGSNVNTNSSAFGFGDPSTRMKDYREE